jgi:hypothetical protein
VHFNPITTGARNGTQIQVVSGLEANQRVVVQGAGFLGEGDVVTVVEPRAAPAAAAAAAAAAAPAGAAGR